MCDVIFGCVAVISCTFDKTMDECITMSNVEPASMEKLEAMAFEIGF